MPQIDKLLPHLAARGGRTLRLQPGCPPVIVMPGGGEITLLPDAMPGRIVERLALEILGPAQGEAYQAKGQAETDYACQDRIYHVSLQRTAGGAVLTAEIAPLAPATPPPPTARTTVEPNLDHARASLTPAPTPMAVATHMPLIPPTPSAPPPQQAASAEHPPLTVTTSEGIHPLALRLFSALLKHQGSDLHLTSFEPPMARIHGDLEELPGFDVFGSGPLLALMESVAPGPAWARFQQTGDADFAYAFEAGGCRLRVNYFRDHQGPGVVCRVIPNEIPDPDKLGLPETVRRLALLSKGLVLVTGPTGSGKSTTLAAIIDLANRQRNDHILTIEDPIEFVHPRKKCLVNQREIGAHTDSFKTGLRAALREDPDIVLVGEMRDLETIAIALETAVTGHLVFGTLHTSSAIGTIDRIVDQFPADRQQQIRVMLADALKAVISQTLLKKIGGGRVAAMETLFLTPAIANLIREAKNFQIPSQMQTGKSYGQRMMNDALIELIQAKKIEAMEAYMKCPDKDSFMQAVKRAGSNFDPRATGVTEF
jgi:twitching motility protein PilT